MKIGVPRALLYHRYETFFNTFFTGLPLETEISPPTDREILERGVASCADDACLPVKVFAGHVETLREKCDKIAVPRIMNCEFGESLCPKLNGLPELIGGDDLIFTQKIDMSSENALFRSLYAPCRRLGVKRSEFKKSFSDAISAWKNGQTGLCQTGFNRTVFLSAHAYNARDSFVNMDIVRKLNSMDVGVITEEAVDRLYKEKYMEGLIKKPFWQNFVALYGAARYLEERKVIDGIICLSSFSCGTDSFTVEMIRGASNLPLLVLKLDEMTAEAGFDTRLEAFCEVISS